MGKVQKILKGKSSLQLIDEDEPTQPEPEPEPEPEHQGEGEEYDVEQAIQMSLESFQAQIQAHVGGVATREPVEEATRPLPVVEGKGKAIATEEQAAQSLLALYTPKRRSTMNQFIFQRRTPATEEASTGPSAQPQDNASANIVRESLSPADAKTCADSDKTNSGGDTEILQIGEEQSDDVANVVNLEEKTAEIDKGHTGSDPGKTPESRPPPDDDKMDEDQAGSDPRESRVALAGPNLEPTHNEFMANVHLNVHESLKFPAYKHIILEDLLTSSSVPPLSTPVIDLLPPKPVPSTTQAPIFTATTATTTTTLPPPPQQQSITDSELAACVTTLKKKISDFEQKSNTLDNTTQNLGSRVFALELRDMPHKINQTVNEVVKESGTYKSLPEHVALYEAPEASMERANIDEFLTENDKSRKRRHGDQDPPPPPPDSDLTWKTSDTREAPSSSSKKQSGPYFEKLVEDVPMPDTTHISDSEDTESGHLPKIKPRPEWLKPIPEEDRPATLEPDWMEECHLLLTDQVDLANPEGHRIVPYVSKPLPLGGPPGQLKAANYPDFGFEELVLSLWIESVWDYDISAAYGISHCVVCLKTLERYGYTYLKEIVLRRADYKDYKISEDDFKNLHPNDFEDLYLLHLQGQVNHLSGADKVHLFNAVNLWIRNIVIRKRVEDLQLGIESYQTKLNLTQPDWDASDFLFKEDYTIVSKPRAIIYKDINDQK
ncbi:hypothetical protein Tco_0804316 [Tanacetum coccineum]|uniref:Uncharacterized protein n=1 Tax=Tanacetum coccineum TaxID=301880 RepID=A0ABQ5A5P4_9ASTR